MNAVAAYELALAEALRIKVEEDILEMLFPGDEAQKEIYRAHGVGRAPLTRDHTDK